MKVIQCVPPTVLPVTRKAGDVVNYQFGIVNQSQAAGGGVAEELIAQATFDAGDDFPLQERVRRKTWKVDLTCPESSQRR